LQKTRDAIVSSRSNNRPFVVTFFSSLLFGVAVDRLLNEAILLVEAFKQQ